MSRATRVARGVGLAAAGTLAVAGAAYGAARFASGRLRVRPGEREVSAIEPVVGRRHRFASHDGGTIHVVEAGEGIPIVLSHGVTLSVRTWVHQLERLPALGFRAIAFDHRGHGASVLGSGGHTVEALGTDIRTVLEALDLRDAVLVGHSMGGIAVQAFAIDHPDILAARVRGIVLLSTLARVPLGSQATRFKRRLEQLTRRAPDSTPLWASPTFGPLAARIGFGRDPRPEHVELVRQMMLECAIDTRRDAPTAIIGLDFTPDLPSVDVPTLVVGGTADVLTPPHEARRIAALVPGARLHLFPGGGHMLMLERTDELNALLAEFAREVTAAAAGSRAAGAS